MNRSMKIMLVCFVAMLAVQMALAASVEAETSSAASADQQLGAEDRYCRSFITMKRTRDSNIDLCVECCKNEFGDSARWTPVFANKGCYCRPAGQ